MIYSEILTDFSLIISFINLVPNNVTNHTLTRCVHFWKTSRNKEINGLINCGISK